jgi:hypothetical protein
VRFYHFRRATRHSKHPDSSINEAGISVTPATEYAGAALNVDLMSIGPFRRLECLGLLKFIETFSGSFQAPLHYRVVGFFLQ